jgi:hypothetical protein
VDILHLKDSDTLQLSWVSEKLDDILSGFNGHLLASYLWYVGRTRGSLSPVEVSALHRLIDASPTDPMYIALHQRFTDGNQDKALRLLLDAPEFNDRLDMDGVFGWGSAPAKVYYIIVFSIIGGK